MGRRANPHVADAYTLDAFRAWTDRSRENLGVGTAVDSPQPGDIIVTPGHVGLYAGPNLQIDSPRPGKTIEFRAIWQRNPTYIRVTG